MKLLMIKVILIVRFMTNFFREIFVANLRVAHDVVTPKYHARPGVIAVPLDCKMDIEITLLAIVVSLTPGTLALDVSPDRKFLYIHAMFLNNKEEMIREIKQTFEKPIMRILE